jgi:hypothetical protein
MIIDCLFDAACDYEPRKTILRASQLSWASSSCCEYITKQIAQPPVVLGLSDCLHHVLAELISWTKLPASKYSLLPV